MLLLPPQLIVQHLFDPVEERITERERHRECSPATPGSARPPRRGVLAQEGSSTGTSQSFDIGQPLSLYVEVITVWSSIPESGSLPESLRMVLDDDIGEEVEDGQEEVSGCVSIEMNDIRNLIITRLGHVYSTPIASLPAVVRLSLRFT